MEIKDPRIKSREPPLLYQEIKSGKNMLGNDLNYCYAVLLQSNK